ncbi:hypothetical protein ACROYT_G023928 [Oculina patagonica]
MKQYKPSILFMELQDLTYVVLAVSVVGCVCQVLLCIAVIYLLIHQRRVQKKIQHLCQMVNDSCNRNSTEFLPLRELLPLRAEPVAGETITVLHRNPHPPLPTQFVNTGERSGEGAKTEGHHKEESNEGFELELNE